MYQRPQSKCVFFSRTYNLTVMMLSSPLHLSIWTLLSNSLLVFCYSISVCLDRMINYLSIWFLFWEIGSCAGWTCTRRNWFKWLTETPGGKFHINKKKSRCCKELKVMRKYFKHQMIIRLHLHIIVIRVLYLCCQNWKVYDLF